MWSKVKELISEGLKKTQISNILEIHRETVAKYAAMSFDEFTASRSYHRVYAHKLDAYEDYVVGLLDKYPSLSAAQVHDRLREHYPNLENVSEKTVFNFVRRMRLTHNIPKDAEESTRQMNKLPETAYGEYAQVDFGEFWMRNQHGSRTKVYFFVMVLSRSRYKYVYFSKKPFNSELAVYAHELAFQYFGGKPQKIVYDQDRVFIVDENLGDYKLTRRFNAFRQSENFEVVFCRKSDPQSKGKVENVVKYVKRNFCSAREYVDADTLNTEVLGWLERTANGTMHHGIRQVPATLFNTERDFLTPYNGTPTLPDDSMQERNVLKDNTIMYEGCFYSVPAGTYREGGVTVYADCRDGVLTIFDKESGKTLCSHAKSEDKGKSILNTNHRRSPELSLNALKSEVEKLLPEHPVVGKLLAAIRDSKPRYFRDSLAVLKRKCEKYDSELLVEVFTDCLNGQIYNAHTIMEITETRRRQRGLPLKERKSLPATDCSLRHSEAQPDTSDIATYQNIFNETA